MFSEPSTPMLAPIPSGPETSLQLHRAAQPGPKPGIELGNWQGGENPMQMEARLGFLLGPASCLALPTSAGESLSQE